VGLEIIYPANMKTALVNVLFCLLLSTAAYGQVRQKPVPKPSPEPSVDNQVVAPGFDPAWTKLPPAFVPNDLLKVHNILLSSKVFDTKDEFETTADFQKRYGNLQLIAIRPNQTGDDLLVFEFFDSFLGMSAKYDADAQVLSVGLQSKTRKYIPDTPILKELSMPVVQIAYSKTTTTSKGLITTDNIWFYGVGINNIDAFGNQLPPYQLTSSADSARQLKKDVAVLLIGHLAKPYRAMSILSVKARSKPPTTGILLQPSLSWT
jgi:hypothetical protein